MVATAEVIELDELRDVKEDEQEARKVDYARAIGKVIAEKGYHFGIDMSQDVTSRDLQEAIALATPTILKVLEAAGQFQVNSASYETIHASLSDAPALVAQA